MTDTILNGDTIPSTEPSKASLSPNTTHQQDLTTAGQRVVNLIWERTQAVIALVVVGSTMGVAVFMVVARIFNEQIPTIFSFAFGTVVGFYFSRTNHMAIGGIGVKATEGQEYRGR